MSGHVLFHWKVFTCSGAIRPRIWTKPWHSPDYTRVYFTAAKLCLSQWGQNSTAPGYYFVTIFCCQLWPLVRLSYTAVLCADWKHAFRLSWCIISQGEFSGAYCSITYTLNTYKRFFNLQLWPLWTLWCTALASTDWKLAIHSFRVWWCLSWCCVRCTLNTFKHVFGIDLSLTWPLPLAPIAWSLRPWLLWSRLRCLLSFVSSVRSMAYPSPQWKRWTEKLKR